jgi:hypothetical protein
MSSIVHMATVDVADGQGEAFSRWYNEVHLPEMMGCPGWDNARRYECTDGQPRFLALYDIGDLEVAFSSPEFDAAFGWDEFARHIRNSHSRNYRQIHEAGEFKDPPALIHVATVDVADGQEGAFSRWYNEVHLPEMMGCPGWEGVRRYECTDGQPRFLAIYDLSDEEVAFSSPEFDAAFGWDEFARHIRNSHSRNYRLIHRDSSR